jgi:hypothetical protein
MCHCIFFCSGITLNVVTLASCFFVTAEIIGILAWITTRAATLRAEAEVVNPAVSSNSMQSCYFFTWSFWSFSFRVRFKEKVTCFILRVAYSVIGGLVMRSIHSYKDRLLNCSYSWNSSSDVHHVKLRRGSAPKSARILVTATL